MNENLSGFREQLLANEPVNQNLRDKYQQEMEKMFTEEITGVKRVGWWVKNLMLLTLGIALVLSAVFNKPVPMYVPARWLWGLSGIFTLAMGLLDLILGWNKKLNQRKDFNLMANIGFAGMFLLGNALIFVGFMSRNIEEMAIIAPMVMLIFIIGILIKVENRVKQSELNTRENLLEIKYALAQIEERLGDRK